jgi:hypothetical protein
VNEDTQTVGVVTDDPTKSLPVGSKLQFRPVPVRGDVPEGAATLKNWQFFEGMLVHIAFTDHAVQRVEGSGVLVAPGVALCATHVVAPHLERLMAGEAIATCFGISTHSLQIWNVRKVTAVQSTDITILGLELTSALPPENIFIQSIITTRTPKIGEQLTICGFRASEASFQRGEQGVEASGDMWVCRGAIVETYPHGRDRAMLPWPALAVNVPSRGGMSGGPAYDRDGLLVGLLCSSTDYDDGNGTSYVSMLWPALTARFEGVWPSGLYRGALSLLELDSRLCAIDKPDSVSVRYEQSGTVHTEYRVWE